MFKAETTDVLMHKIMSVYIYIYISYVMARVKDIVLQAALCIG